MISRIVPISVSPLRSLDATPTWVSSAPVKATSSRRSAADHARRAGRAHPMACRPERTSFRPTRETGLPSPAQPNHRLREIDRHSTSIIPSPLPPAAVADFMPACLLYSSLLRFCSCEPRFLLASRFEPLASAASSAASLASRSVLSRAVFFASVARRASSSARTALDS
jgi:hypothetical protein